MQCYSYKFGNFINVLHYLQFTADPFLSFYLLLLSAGCQIYLKNEKLDNYMNYISQQRDINFPPAFACCCVAWSLRFQNELHPFCMSLFKFAQHD